MTASTPVEGVCVLAFNRPAKRNALSQELIREFLQKLSAASLDDNVRSIVVTGSSTFFCGELHSTQSVNLLKVQMHALDLA